MGLPCGATFLEFKSSVSGGEEHFGRRLLFIWHLTDSDEEVCLVLYLKTLTIIIHSLISGIEIT